jgi:D-arabinose 5-phosphate isomerase GutQ
MPPPAAQYSPPTHYSGSATAPPTSRRYDQLWKRLGDRLAWVAAQGISTHWLHHKTLTWIERHFGYGVARAYAGHTDEAGPATTTYIKANRHVALCEGRATTSRGRSAGCTGADWGHMYGRQAAGRLRRSHPELFGQIPAITAEVRSAKRSTLGADIIARIDLIHDTVRKTVEANPSEVETAVGQFSRWMDDRAIVRVLGAGRARLAAAIPANRLAHGGARVYLQDAIVPMPHSLHGGGIIAASASGRTPSVLTALAQAKQKNSEIRIVGVAAHDATTFRDACDIFIGLDSKVARHELSALADIEEYAISELLDSIVVAAGRLLGYTDATWRLGHEDLGPATGPYDHLGTSL